jgi:hypothetical protein
LGVSFELHYRTILPPGINVHNPIRAPLRQAPSSSGQHHGINDHLKVAYASQGTPGRMRGSGDGTQRSLCMFLHACLVLGGRVIEHPRVGRKRMKRRQDCQHGQFGVNPSGQGDAVLNFPARSEPSVGIRMLEYIHPRFGANIS